MSPLPPHFPWQEEHLSNTLCTGTASIPVPEPVLSTHTHTQRETRPGLLHTLCDTAAAAGTLPTIQICHPAASSASPCQCQAGAREVPITMPSMMRQAAEVFQKRLPFETRIKASEQLQLILSSLCVLLVYTPGWFSSTCAQGNVKPKGKKKKAAQKTNPPRSTGNQ